MRANILFPTAFTSKSGGKSRALEHILKNVLPTHKTENGVEQHSIVMIGDGVTDLEAKPPAIAMIGFGGVVVREKVKAEADYFVMSFEELITMLTD